jgi:hypothetical protein
MGVPIPVFAEKRNKNDGLDCKKGQSKGRQVSLTRVNLILWINLNLEPEPLGE